VGTFDNLWWPSLLRKLKNIKIHSKHWKIIKKYFNNRLIKVDTADGVVAKMSTKGCP